MPKEKYCPEWISEKEATEWLNLHRNTLIKWRKTKQLHFTQVNNRHTMYDKIQLNTLLNNNSTYAAAGMLK